MAKSANAEDLKSSDSNILWVQVPLSPLQIKQSHERSGKIE